MNEQTKPELDFTVNVIKVDENYKHTAQDKLTDISIMTTSEWKDPYQSNDWTAYINMNLRFMWNSFTYEQRLAIAKNALELFKIYGPRCDLHSNVGETYCSN